MWVPRVSLLQASGYLQHVLDELDEKTPALQQLRRNYETAMKNCDQLTAQLTSTVEVYTNVCYCIMYSGSNNSLLSISVDRCLLQSTMVKYFHI